MSDNIKFTPIRGKEKTILQMPKSNGNIYFTTDTGRIYLDTAELNKLIIGGNGISLFYGSDPLPQQDSLIDDQFTLDLRLITDYVNCKVGDLILNQSDGCFYKVLEINANKVVCVRLSVSGSGGGISTGGTKRGKVSISNDGEPDILNGDTATVTITVTSMTYDNDPVQANVPVTIALAAKDSVSNTYKTYYSETRTAEHDVPFTYDATSLLREDTETKIICTANPSESNEFSVPSNEVTITTHALELSWNTTAFDSLRYFENGSVNVQCQVSTGLNRIFDLYFDDQLVYVGKLDKSSTSSDINYTITANTTIKNFDGTETKDTIASLFTHGAHIIKAKVSLTKTDGTRGNGTEFISKEIALKVDNTMPLIWLGDCADTYYEYDTILVPYRVYDPDASQYVEVHLSKNGVEIDGSPRNIESTLTDWSYWEISDLEVNDSSYYTIRIGKDEKETKRNLTFTILEDPRHMQVIPTPTASFDSKGRSNTESKAKRETLIVAGEKATFKNFNWYNNGWVFDDNQTTCLRISNGASVSIPVGSVMEFQGGGNTTTAHTIELQFKIKNVQNYSKLVTSYTRYTDESGWSDEKAFADFLAQKNTGYSNYDAYLANYWLEANADSGVPSYDDLEYSSTYKAFDFSNVICSYAAKTAAGEMSDSNPGIYIGPADAFFTNGTNAITVDFIEDQMLNLAFVFTGGSTTTGGDLLMEIYLNGVLTGIARSSQKNSWTINSKEITFNSEVCDIDLYKIRTYDKALLIPEIIQNYAFDLKDTAMWDQKDLCTMNNNLNEYLFSYNKMITYNEEHPTAPLMPYMVLHTTAANSQNRLPYSKNKEAVVGSMEFVNTALDAAYANGTLSKKAEEAGVTVEEYYLHHCPSWISADNKVSFSVQGTSSQFYPRRNFKAKTKGNMYNNRGPFALAYAEDPKSTPCTSFYFDNDTVGTDKFTLKIDYMESSGDYNRGFANLVATTYSKHPIEDYKSVFENYSLYGDEDDYRTSVQGFPVLTFHEPDDGSEPIFIGIYNMLTDKGSAEVYGFKPDKKITTAAIDDESYRVRDIAECWEFENNSRGFCSFRDPWGRKELSFAAPEGATDELTANGAPIVADSFEYRYSANDDNFDILYDLNNASTETNQAALVGSFVNSAPGKITVEKAATEEENDKIFNSKGEQVDLVNNPASGRQLMLDLYSNWEKAVAWVWSTCTDSEVDGKTIPSIGTYVEVKNLAEALYQKNKYYTQTDENYELSTDATMNADETYYILEDGVYRVILLTDDSDKVYKTKTYYTLIDADNGIYLINEDSFNENETYYSLSEDESLIDDYWTLATPVTYGSKTYTKDTKEYRQAKFINELSKHFDVEYLATYFIMTEIFECYDSRGKNAMFASWGPQKKGGEYIWYPIFYDIDTQLGINNTGIPSFEYYVDATEDGSFSTNDSVLWNNFYYYFKGTIIEKYKQLMGDSSNIFTTALSNPLFKRDTSGNKVSTVEKWYTSDADVTDSYAMRGDRPLVAFNLGEYYKYITPTNEKAKNTYWGRLTDAGEYSVEGDTYFYALQGDRKLYRQQFLTNRLEYIDSWLTLDNYARGGSNRIRSRISANNPVNTSDQWISGTATNGVTGLTTNEPYWEDGVEFGNKVHEFDGEYWVTMTPIRNSYVTVGTDAANFPSEKYTGSPVRFVTSDLKNGVMNSGNYREQLYYIYGLNQMKSLGDLSKLYLQEFELTGSATKMTDLLMGYDGLDEGGRSYKNEGVNTWTVPAGASGDGMPLLKEVNLSNIKFKDNNVTFDFSSCEKLENFRNTGSNIVQVTFADGVALNTLYLTSETTTLKLTEARLLKNLVTEYHNPVKNSITGKLEVAEADQGLYIADLTDKDNDNATTKITTLNIAGGGLGYNSYKLLEKFYWASSSNRNVERKVSLTDVQWSPYSLIEDTETEYDETQKYYLDNGHFGLDAYVPASDDEWQLNLNNKAIYLYDTDIAGIEGDGANITSPTLFTQLADSSVIKSLTGSDIPTITGIVYIDNDTEIDEGDIQSLYQDKYPDLTFFFKKVIKGYSAKFVIQQNNTQTLIGSQKISKDHSEDVTFFNKPSYSLSDLKDYMPNYNFVGWSTNPEGTDLVIRYSDVAPDDGTTQSAQSIISDTWDTLKLEEGKTDYVFYAIYSIKRYVARFYNGNMTEYYDEIVDDGKRAYAPGTSYTPTLDDSKLALSMTYGLQGWRKIGINEVVNDVTLGTPTDLSNGVLISSYTRFAPIFKEVSVYDNVLGDEYFSIDTNSAGNTTLRVLDGVKLKGKITVPVIVNGKAINTIGDSAFINQPDVTHIFWAKTDGTCPITTFSERAFYQMSSLVYFEMPSSVTTLGNYCFNNNTYLFHRDYVDFTQSDLDNMFKNIRSIGTYSFVRCPMHGALNFSSQLTYLGTYAFNNSEMTSITFGSSDKASQLTEIGSNVFRNCNDLTSVTCYIDSTNSTKWATEIVPNFDLSETVPVSYVSVNG